MNKTYVIINSKNKLFKYKAETALDALNKYVTNDLKYGAKFNISEETWLGISRLINSIEVKVEFLNGFCKVSGDKVKKVMLEASACPFEQTEIQYEISTDFSHAVVTACENTCETAVIASTYDGLPVKSIRLAAFENCTKLTSITYLGTEDQWEMVENKNVLSSKSIEFQPLLEELTLISTRKNKLYIYETSNAKDALKQHITEVLGFNKRFEMSEDEWTALSNLSKSRPISVKMGLINGLCRFSGDNISRVSTGTFIYPSVNSTAYNYEA